MKNKVLTQAEYAELEIRMFIETIKTGKYPVVASMHDELVLQVPIKDMEDMKGFIGNYKL